MTAILMHINDSDVQRPVMSIKFAQKASTALVFK